MSVRRRLERLEQNIGDDVGPPPQEYYDARARSTRYLRAITRRGLGEELGEEECTFVEDYQDSALQKEDLKLIGRYAPPRSEEQAARARVWIKENLAAMAKRRREVGS